MGPLQGLRIIEIEGLGPAPFAGMMFADMGAEVISVTRKSAAEGSAPVNSISERGKKSIALNLKDPRAVEALLKLCETADALIEGFRPGVAERLGIGPDDCMARNPKLVYGRMTGWGQTGPMSQAAGHDINYISLSGALHGIGRAGDKPVPPLNLVGDFGGGGMFLAFGVVRHAGSGPQREGASCGCIHGRGLGCADAYDVQLLQSRCLWMARRARCQRARYRRAFLRSI